MNERIKEIRKQAGLSQTEFADRIGLTKNFISLVETGGRAPSDRTISDICREFGVNEAWLRTGVGEPHRQRGREEELMALTRTLFADRPDSFRTRLITALLRIEPESPEWEIFERLYERIAAENKRPGT